MWIFIIVVLLIVLCIVFKVRIKFKTFLKKGFVAKRGKFGVYCYTGNQGKGKTYSLVEYLYDNKDTIEVFGNIPSINIDGLHYTFFTGFKGLVDLKNKLDNNTLNYDQDRQLVFVYDELFEELQRGSKVNKEVLDFLCQMRKRKIIFLTTCQVWSELPITFRKFCRFQIDCKMYNLLFFSVLLKHFRDGENMKWSNDDQDFIAPLISNTISKARKHVSSSYNTFERITSVVGDGAPSTATPDTTNNATASIEML